jgi:hypothetical protein
MAGTTGIWIVNQNSASNAKMYVITTYTSSTQVSVDRSLPSLTGATAYIGANPGAGMFLTNPSGEIFAGLHVMENGGTHNVAAQFTATVSQNNVVRMLNAPNSGSTSSGFTNQIQFYRGALGGTYAFPTVDKINAHETGRITSDISASGSYSNGRVTISARISDTLTDVGTFDQNGLTISTGTVIVASIPASAGAGGLYVCADSAGTLYRKASCP